MFPPWEQVFLWGSIIVGVSYRANFMKLVDGFMAGKKG